MGSSKDKRRKKNKKPKIASPEKIAPSEPTLDVDKDAYRKETPVWQVSKIDNESEWGWKYIGKDRWEKTILPHLVSRESMTWAAIELQTHGKKNKTCNHEIKVSDIIPAARKRLEELRRDDYDVLFSLRVNGKIRIWGNREGRIFQIFWFDFEHEICPSLLG